MTLHGLKVFALVLWFVCLPVFVIKALVEPWAGKAATEALKKAFGNA